MERVKRTGIMKWVTSPLVVWLCLFCFTDYAFALPQGAKVESGQATFESPDANTLNITAGDKTIINFDSFNIGAKETVRFIQPFDSASVLGRVLGGGMTEISGNLFANGLLFLVNPAGIHFNPTANVQVNQLVASTLALSSRNFLDGNYLFERQAGSPTAFIMNEGNILGKNIALLGSAASNLGVIVAQAGTAHLASGDKATVSFDSRGLLNVAITEETSGKVIGLDGVSVKDAVANAGSIEGKQVLLSAKTAKDIFENAVNQTGIVKATQTVDEGGVIRIVANRNMQVSGTLEAKGGTVEVQSGESLKIDSQLNTAGDTTISVEKSLTIGDGVTLRGGNTEYQVGEDWINNGKFIGELSTVSLVSNRAAKVMGQNEFNNFSIVAPGKIVMFDSEHVQTVKGALTLKGDFGNLLTLTSINKKQWTIDPQGATDIQYTLIGDAKSLTPEPLKTLHSSSLGNNTNFDIDPYWIGAGSDWNWSTGANWDTGHAPYQYDSVTFDGTTSHSEVSGQHPNKESFMDDDTYTIANMTIDGYTGFIHQGGNLHITGNFSQSSGFFDSNNGSAGGPTYSFSVDGSFSLTGGSFNRFQGNGSSGTPYVIRDVYDLQAMKTTHVGSIRGMPALDSSFILGNDIDADQTRNWNSGAGFEPIARIPGSGGPYLFFSGDFNGSGHIISNLFIHRPDVNYAVGLFSQNSGSISNLGLINVDITGGSDAPTGGLIGNKEGNVNAVYVTGNVAGHNWVGGMVGCSNAGGITNSYAAVNVTATGDEVGGLVGIETGNISNSFATGTVSGSGSLLGGLVGVNSGTISNSYYTDTSHPGAGQTTTLNALMNSSHAVYNKSGSQWDISYNNGHTWIMAGLPHLQAEWSNTITNLAQLQMMSLNSTANYTLANDIDATDTKNWNGGKGFAPITTGSSVSLDGQGHEISNLMINRSPEADVGLFGYLYAGGLIKDLGLVNVNVTGGENIGALVGHGGGMTIQKVYVTGKITGNDQHYGNPRAGGLIGYENGSSTISDSYSTVNLINKNSSGWFGGLVGILGGSSTIARSYATGSLTTGSANAAGGLVSYADESSVISDSFTAVTHSGDGWYGSLVGWSGSASLTISNSYSTDQTNGLVGYAWGGSPNITNGSGATTLNALKDGSSAVYTRAGHAWDMSYESGHTWIMAGLPHLQSEWTSNISNVVQLQMMTLDKTASYTLTANINAADTANWNGGKGFMPIAGISGAFNGIFNGNNKTIDKLTIIRPDRNYVGLFGFADGEGAASIQNIKLTNLKISGGDYVGGLAGNLNNGNIGNSSVSGTVSGSSRVGGLAGVNGGTITGSSSSATVTGTGDMIGGFVGQNYWTITSSSSSGGVNAANSSNVGGFVGQSSGNITGSSATGRVTVSSGANAQSIGGFAGYNEGDISGSSSTGNVSIVGILGCCAVGGFVGDNEGTIEDSYSTGSITGNPSDFGGLVGYGGGTVSNSHYDIDKVSINGKHQVTVGGLYDTQYQDWVSNAREPLDISTYFNSSSGYYQINGVGTGSKGDLKYILAFTNDGNKFQLANDINLSTAIGFDIPIFSGEFDGNGHAISNLKINLVNQDVGFFKVITSGSEIHDLGLLNANVSGQVAAGILAGRNGGTVERVYTTGSVSGEYGIGGLVGANEGTISDSYSTASIQGSDIGGVVGYNNGSVSHTFSTGALNGSASYTVDGSSVTLANLMDSTSTALSGWDISYDRTYTVDEVTYNHTWIMAGLPHLQMEWTSNISNVVQLQMMSLDKSASYTLTGNINALETKNWNGGAGFKPVGVISYDEESNLVDDIAFKGTLDGNSKTIDKLTINRPDQNYVGLIGGLGGSASIHDVKLTNVNISGAGDVGGLVGEMLGGTISNASVSGNVSGAGAAYYVGGLVGDVLGIGPITGSITGSSSSAAVTVTGDSASNTGGLVGYSVGSIENSSSTGRVTASGNNVWNIGGFAGSNDGDITGSFSTARVTVSGSGASNIGGFVGSNDGSISGSSSTGSVSAAGGSNVGGFVGDSHGSIDSSSSTGSVSAAGGSTVGGFVGENFGTIEDSYSTGSVTGGDSVGGLVGYNDGSISNSYYDIDRVTINGKHQVTVGGIYDGQYQDWIGNSKSPLSISSYFTADDDGYYSIRNISELKTMYDLKNILAFSGDGYKFKLANDLDLSPLSGFYVPVFSGEFNGNNHTISNLKLNLPKNDLVGFFGDLEGSVHDLVLLNATVTGFANVGILAGINGGTIERVYTTGSVVSSYGNVGGLVGANSGGITDSYSTARVSATDRTGGLVGYNFGNISNSYSTGAVSATGVTDVGGLVGLNTGGNINNSFSTSKVNGSAGSLVGDDEYGSTSNSVYVDGSTVTLANIMDPNNGIYTASGSEWDLSYDSGHAWIMAGLPHLQMEWTSNISNVAQLQMMTLDKTANYTLTANINAADTANWNGGKGFMPIGVFDPSGTSDPFTGSFDGTHGTSTWAIDKLTINRTDKNGVGLFGYAEGSGIHDVKLTNVNVTGKHFVGGLAGFGNGITNVSVSGSVKGWGDLGGLAGDAAGGISSSSSSATVTQIGNASGASYFFGYVGGLVGWNGGTITSSSSTGRVIISGIGGVWGSIGGFVGWNGERGSISGSSSTGSVSAAGTFQVGGFAGLNQGNISGSSSTGAVSAAGTYQVGGFAGANELSGLIADSYATGRVTAPAGVNWDQIGGFVGENKASITDTYSTGAVSAAGNQQVGGFVGANGGGMITKSFSTGSVISALNAGGFTGDMGGGTITNVYYTDGASAHQNGIGNLTDLATLKGWSAPGQTPGGVFGAWDFDTKWQTKANALPTLRA